MAVSPSSGGGNRGFRLGSRACTGHATIPYTKIRERMFSICGNRIAWSEKCLRQLLCTRIPCYEYNLHLRDFITGWRRSSVVRTLVSGCQTFPDYWLTCDHFVGKVSAMGVTNQPSIFFWIGYHVIMWITGVETIKYH